MAQVSKICSNGAQSINLLPNVSKPQMPRSSNFLPLKSQFLGSSNSLSLKLKNGLVGSWTVGKVRVDPLTVAASVATAEMPSTVPEIVLATYQQKNLPELNIRVSGDPIIIKFQDVKPTPAGTVAQCVLFHLDGSINFSNVESGNMCSAVQQGHFSIAVKSIALSPAPASDLHELQSRRFNCRLRQPRRVL
ncbi:hypothetical protein EV2_006872 [Malus domestica]